MKSIRRFFLYFAILLISSVALLIFAAGSHRYVTSDSIMLNHIVQTVKENWNDLRVLDEKDIDTDILIFDSSDKKLYAKPDKTFENVKVVLDAVRKGMITMPVNEGDLFMGTVVVPSPEEAAYRKTVHDIALITVFIIMVQLISYFIFLRYINRSIAAPFRKMKEFAALVAQGRFDEPLVMDKNNIFGVFTESFDIMREELKASRQRETELKTKEKELIASLSHDLKTPVTGIRAICGVLSLKIQDEYLKAKVENIEQKTAEINKLLNDLLYSALDDLGEMNVSPTEETSDILKAIVDEHDVHSRVRAGDIPDCILRIDKNRMSQVIGNIISNSYKYAGTEIDISYSFSGSFLEMRIRDHGEGVDPEETDFLTNKYYRGRKNSPGKEGSGLGLYISAELMKKMNGQLICISDGKGFEVVLRIPLA
ncbi:MAG: HAMP domain-containing histidine kinase [Lachnospiraceae bacterium]|nr:HAMP domain-containing histidine kinase [Lachnospiraceae bacterium]